MSDEHDDGPYEPPFDPTHYNVLWKKRYYSKTGEEKSRFLVVGAAFKGSKGMNLKLYLMPPADEEGEVELYIRKPFPRY